MGGTNFGFNVEATGGNRVGRRNDNWISYISLGLSAMVSGVALYVTKKAIDKTDATTDLVVKLAEAINDGIPTEEPEEEPPKATPKTKKK